MADIAVIGGGISGALAAFRLADAGLNVVLVDKARFGMGSTLASTALLSYEYDELLGPLIRKMGERKALRAYELCFEAVTELSTIVEAIQNPCGHESKVAIRISSNADDARQFEAESRLRNRHSLPTQCMDGPELERRFGIRAAVGLLQPNAAQLNPVDLTLTLIESAEREGLQAYEHTRITVYESGKHGVLLKAANGAKIRCREVVFATGYESDKFIGRHLARTNTDFCFVSTPTPDLAKLSRCHVVEHAENYLYMSTFGDRLMVGREDPTFSPPKRRSGLLRSRATTLLRRAQEFLPEAKIEIDRRWAGTFAKSKDSLPFLGHTPGLPRAHFLLGYGGNGIASSAMLSSILVDVIRGKGRANAEIFRIDR
ncbi:MAG: Gamma-glutamylputrescine oxidoreductase [Fimbriimonadaceae bacterium]|nr:Gamma-glutamylputrescine oxidoreductase [Fimbriimonadaceae bacterium]